jgi:hypothetical protein
MLADLWRTSGLLPPEVARQTKLLLDFLQDASREWLQGANEALTVNRATLVDHDFTILAVSGDVLGEEYTIVDKRAVLFKETWAWPCT